MLRGLGRDDLFLVVQEQFLTPTARYADIVMPATMFVEHDDIYYGLGHTHLTFGPKLVDPPGEARPNSYTVRELGRLLGADHASLVMTDLELLHHALRRAGMTSFAGMAKVGWVDRALSFERAHFLTGFPQPDGKFHFKPDWRRVGPGHEVMRAIADWSDRYEQADARHPYKLVALPHGIFSIPPSRRRRPPSPRSARPYIPIHPDAAAREGVSEGCRVHIGNYRGSVLLMATLDAGQQVTTLIVEGIWPADAFEEKRAINALIGDDPVPPNGGAGFHDTAVWLQRA